MLKMDCVPNESMDGIFFRHNIEHPYPDELLVALTEFNRGLKQNGSLVITCPYLQTVCQLLAEDKLLDTAYFSPARPMAVIDIFYEVRTPEAAGNLFMAHRCGFTQKVLLGSIYHFGFAGVGTSRRDFPLF